MQKYAIWESVRGVESRVFLGLLDADQVSGKSSVQLVPFGRLYWANGRVTDQYKKRLVGRSCRFVKWEGEGI